jgi:hypothetical protein
LVSSVASMQKPLSLTRCCGVSSGAGRRRSVFLRLRRRLGEREDENGGQQSDFERNRRCS